MRALNLVLVLLFTGCLFPKPPPNCTGGSRLVSNQCVCALGMQFQAVNNQKVCTGTPQAGICQNGNVQFGNQCMCADGTLQEGNGWGCVTPEQCAQQGDVVSGPQCVCQDDAFWNGTKCTKLVCGHGVAQNHQCNCNDDSAWDQNQGTCIQLQCSAGHIAANHACVCPADHEDHGGTCVRCETMAAIAAGGGGCDCQDGYAWNGDRSHCDRLNCTGGSFAQGHECVCPDGKSWADNQCEVACISGAVRVNADRCECPAGTILANNECETCNGGMVASADGSQCVCPNGMTWQDSNGACGAIPGNATAAEQYFHKLIAWTDANGGAHWLQSGLGVANGNGYQPRFDISLDANGHYACDIHWFGSDGNEVTPNGHVEGWWSVDSDHFVINLPGLGIAYKKWVNHEQGIELHVSFTQDPGAFADGTVVDAFMTR
jgi:hypothetical protein